MVDQNAPDKQQVVSPATPIGADGPYASARRVVVREVEALLRHVEEDSCTGLVAAIRDAHRVFVAGAGRSKLSVEGFAMRLMHLGLTVHVVGDSTTPATAEGDLLLVCSGSGETPTSLVMVENAARSGTRIAAVTAKADSSLAQRADLLVHLAEFSQDHEPGRSSQFVGTLFEQGALLFFDSLILAYEQLYGKDPQDMLARHTNME
ncbi:6-phospho-3-hexuloisomerase [Streptomyces longwoodensis]|uniref:6-phospho-3-hexuloisomerase n=1 Tax=Streptomyces longwoodensis TaxID=68231 RepID=UPI0033FC1967